MLISKDIKKLVEIEVAKQLRTQRFDSIETALDIAAEHENGRVPSQRRLVAEVWAEGVEAARTTEPQPGDFTGTGMITIAVDEPKNAEEADAVAVARATEVARREIQERRSVAAADLAGIRHVGITVVDDTEERTLSERMRALIPWRSKSSDDSSYEIV